MACMPRESKAKQLEDYETHLLQLKSECETVIEQLNQKVMILLEIREDTSPIQEKIWILENHLISIEKELQDVQYENYSTFLHSFCFYFISYASIFYACISVRTLYIDIFILKRILMLFIILYKIRHKNIMETYYICCYPC